MADLFIFGDPAICGELSFWGDDCKGEDVGSGLARRVPKIARLGAEATEFDDADAGNLGCALGGEIRVGTGLGSVVIGDRAILGAEATVGGGKATGLGGGLSFAIGALNGGETD